MLRRFSDFKNLALAARDGEIGKVKELYFDDQSWIVRYVVVDTGGWLAGRVLLAPRSFGTIDHVAKLIAVHLTKEQIENSPPVEADNPVSRQHEEEWHRYYGYPGYWLAPEAIAFGAMPPVVSPPETQAERPPSERGDPHLRSTSEVTGYSIHATDGDIGHVDDFIFDDAPLGDPLRRHLAKLVAGKEGDSFARMDRAGELGEEAGLRPPHARDDQERAGLGRDSSDHPRFEEQLHKHHGLPGYWPPVP